MILCSVDNCAQSTFPLNGAANPEHPYYAFTSCILHLDANTTLTNATLLIRDGKVEEASEKVQIPPGAIVVNLRGKHIYPSFIELYSDYGMPEAKLSPRIPGPPQTESTIKGAYGWNQAVRPETDASKVFLNQDAKADELRKMGFGMVLTGPKDGIIRGTGALVTLNTQKRENENILKEQAGTFFSFSKGTSTQDYPSSLMGSIALIRQTYYDAQAYLSAKDGIYREKNISLEAFNQTLALPAIFEVSNKLNALRAAKIGKEFNIKYIIKGAGDEYQRLAEIENTFSRFIIPLNFPEPYDVQDPYNAELVTLAQMKHWEMAPANPAFLQDNFIPFAITSSELKDKSKFIKNLQKAVRYGLNEKNALKTLTSIPADMLGLSDQIGALKKGMLANFLITSKSIFEEGVVIYENWIAGTPYRFEDPQLPDLRGQYELGFYQLKFKVEMSGEPAKLNGTIFLRDTVKTKMEIGMKDGFLTMYYYSDSSRVERFDFLYSESNAILKGRAQLSDGTWADATLSRTGDMPDKKNEPGKKSNVEVGQIYYPFVSYGKPEKKENLIQKYKNRCGAILIKKATIWTNEKEGIIAENDVYIVDGKIVRIAPNIDAEKNAFAKIIDGHGKHLTAGIIDEHSHIAISEGVNEGSQASSAEVRIGDVVNSEDINIYRQLSGGVTTAHLLHGSANPIGGQTQLIKLRWGLAPESLKYEKWDGFIKFALGENVKQSNWGDFQNHRFPQTRMGVEQLYMDYFIRAKEYSEKWNEFNSGKNKGAAPRRDLELDALSEILAGQRSITCHSYMQSEILMLLHVADSLHFKVNTFTHILEGYKVADALKAHGSAASTFSDWWAYKMEVMDAIPYNAALLDKMGIVTSINSDDAEMGRRLNQEAAKSIKYGGLTEEEALKLCTLNPAKMLHIDDKVGSVKVGKVADLVLWTDNPLSVQAKVDKTIIDGIIFFDADSDFLLREDILKERSRLIAKMLKEKQNGSPLQMPTRRRPHLDHCDSMNGDFEETDY